MSCRRSWFLWGLAAVLAACQPAVTPTSLPPVPIPTQPVIRVDHTPALATWIEWLNQCALETAPDGRFAAGLVVHERPVYTPAAEKVDLILQVDTSPPPGLSASQVGFERLAVIAHPDNPVDELGLESLVEIYTGRLTTWSAVDPGADFEQAIQPWSYEAGDDLGAGFERLILTGEAQISPAVRRAPDPAAMLQAVAENPGAVGVVPASWLDPTVGSIVRLETDEWALPVVALTPGNPQGPVRPLIGCLQAKPADTP